MIVVVWFTLLSSSSTIIIFQDMQHLSSQIFSNEFI
jgi:hypothetical protein